jgi:BirA family biotin operon repressor/biotin-[acetyl-CoA-carboxylase] ligase
MISWYEACPSTQDLAWQLESPTSPHGHFILAKSQTQGRGRGAGREWVSPSGGLYLSWRLPVPKQGLDPRGLSLLGALAVFRACSPYVDGRLWLKWPNDCWLERGKLAGILPDCRWSGSVCSGAVLGIGVNLEAAELPEGAVALTRSPGLEPFFEELREHLEELFRVHQAQGLAGYLSAVRGFLPKTGTSLSYLQNGKTFQDELEGLDDDGALLLVSGQRLVAVERLSCCYPPLPASP